MGTHTFERIDSIASKLAEKMDQTLRTTEEKRQAQMNAPQGLQAVGSDCIADGEVWLKREHLGELLGRMQAGIAAVGRRATRDDHLHH